MERAAAVILHDTLLQGLVDMPLMQVMYSLGMRHGFTDAEVLAWKAMFRHWGVLPTHTPRDLAMMQARWCMEADNAAHWDALWRTAQASEADCVLPVSFLSV